MQHPHRLRSHARWPTILKKAVGFGTTEKNFFELQSNVFHTVFNPVTGYRSFFHGLRANRSPALSVQEELYFHKTWFELVSRSTIHEMTSIPDRSLVILGLARAIQDGRQDLEYRHGLWRRHLLFDLLWFVESGWMKKPSEHGARSWSWQSVDGKIGISHESLVAGKERAWIKAAELMTQEVENSEVCDESEEKDRLILKCTLSVHRNFSKPKSAIHPTVTNAGRKGRGYLRSRFPRSRAGELGSGRDSPRCAFRSTK